MALTMSTMLALGTSLPTFELPEAGSGRMVRSQDWTGKEAVLVIFLCRHCPYVVHVQEELFRLGRDYQAKPLQIVGISSNDATQYPLDAPESLAEMAKELGLTFPICYDEMQAVAKMFTAACTPDFFLFNHDKQLVYRGQLDDSRPGNGKAVTGRDVRGALDAVLGGQLISGEQRPSAGCNIKWKRGHEPNY